MYPTDDQTGVHGRSSNRSTRPIRLAGSELGAGAHVCAFFRDRDEEYRVLLPFIKEGLECGEKAFHTVDPRRRDDHIRRLALAGIDVAGVRQSRLFELRSWTETHLRAGRFDQHRTLALFGDAVKDAKQKGYPLVRFVTHMEWALEDAPGVGDLLEYEARANEIWLHQDGPVNPVICTYDLTRFSGELVIDIVRTHPMVIIAGVLQENPLFVPPDEFLRERRERLATRNKSGPIET